MLKSALLIAAYTVIGSHARLATYSFVGCFMDHVNTARDLKGLQGIKRISSHKVESYGCVISDLNLSLEFCAGICSLGGFRYLGLQNERECFCHNSYGSQGVASSPSQCSAACPGGGAAPKCGGESRNSIYEIVYAHPSAAKPGQSEFALSLTRNSIEFNTNSGFELVPAPSMLACLAHCGHRFESCQAVLFAQQPPTGAGGNACYLLRFALIPSSSGLVGGKFYVRV